MSLHLFLGPCRSCDSTFGLDSLNNEDDLGWFSSAQPNEETEGAMTDDTKPDKMLENQRTPMLQVEDFLNSSESNHTLEDEYGYTVVGNSAQGKSSENVSDTSLQKMDMLMLDVEVSQFFISEFLRLPKHIPPLIRLDVASMITLSLATYCMFGVHYFFILS